MNVWHYFLYFISDRIMHVFVCPLPRYAWTEYKFICVCVCVIVTLAVNSPTVRPLNGFLQLIA